MDELGTVVLGVQLLLLHVVVVVVLRVRVYQHRGVYLGVWLQGRGLLLALPFRGALLLVETAVFFHTAFILTRRGLDPRETRFASLVVVKVVVVHRDHFLEVLV